MESTRTHYVGGKENVSIDNDKTTPADKAKSGLNITLGADKKIRHD